MAIKRGTSLADILNGTALNDQLFGLGGNDRLIALGGNDRLDGGTGTDTMIGGTGNDTYVVDRLADKIVELIGQGTDLVLSAGGYSLGGNTENLTLTGTAAVNGTGNNLANILIGNSGANTLNGGLGDDTLLGGAGADTLNGGDGNDILRPGVGAAVADHINGGSGYDTVDYSDALGPVNVSLGANNTLLAATGDVLTSIEAVIGSRFDDFLAASGTGTLASGGSGNDTIFASASNGNRLRGDDGFDTLILDSFSDDIWLQYDRGIDFVVGANFISGGNLDRILVDSAEFNLATVSGFISPSEFVSAAIGGPPTFTNSTERLFLDTTRQILWADKDGDGTAFSSVPVAFFPSVFGLTAADIFVL